jgi:glycosyltransferase involved in cell wall biosynthesis
MGETLRGAFGGLVPNERIAVVSNGTPPNEAAERSRDTQCVLLLTNLRRRKGVIEALEAAQLTLRKVPSARFLFVGSWEDEALERELKTSTGDTSRIEFLPPVFGRAKDLLLASAGILLFTPREPEGHPRVILEAMAAGLPVVTTDRGAIRETVSNGVTGYVLEDPDPVEIAGRLVELLENPDLYERMSSAALSHYEANYTQAAADARLADWLENIAEQ